MCKSVCACTCMQHSCRAKNRESWGGGGRCSVLVVEWIPDRDCFLSTGPASSLWLLPGQWLGNYEECLETISFCWAHGWRKRGWMAFLCLFLFYIQQIRQAGCCGDDMEEVSCTPAPQTRSPANTDLRNPKGIFSFFFFLLLFFSFFFSFLSCGKCKREGKWERRGGYGRRGKRDRWREKPINIQSA